MGDAAERWGHELELDHNAEHPLHIDSDAAQFLMNRTGLAKMTQIEIQHGTV